MEKITVLNIIRIVRRAKVRENWYFQTCRKNVSILTKFNNKYNNNTNSFKILSNNSKYNYNESLYYNNNKSILNFF